MLIDSHCHLSFKDYPLDQIPSILERARDNGVGYFINIGAGEGFEGNKEAIKLAEKYPNIFCTVGIHPHDAQIVDDSLFKKVEALAHHPKVVAIGEVGLDFHYSHSPHAIQEKVFSDFVDLALKIKKPLMIHDRDAANRSYEILKEKKIKKVMVHCFTGTQELAQKYLDLGYYLSFTGIITFKKSVALQEVVKITPLNQMLIETDSPYLTPEPFRGKRNEPAYVKYVAEKIVALKGVPFEQVASQTTFNARQFFGIDG